MIKFEALAIKAETDKLHAIFFIKEECANRYNQDDIGISINGSTKDTQRIEGSNILLE